MSNDLELITERLKKAIKQKPAKLTQLSELEQQVLQFIRNTKIIGIDVPLYGATTVEIAKAFPHVNSNTLRFTVWSLRKKHLLSDTGIRRSLEKGKTNLAVWQVTGDTV